MSGLACDDGANAKIVNAKIANDAIVAMIDRRMGFLP
jgi:hypothetical protein